MAQAYWDLPQLAGIYLEDSFVLGLQEVDDVLAFEMEFVLTPEHPDYRPAQPNQQHCYARGELRFVRPRMVDWIRRTLCTSTDATGEVDFGAIDALTLEAGRYRLEGDWGEVQLNADTVEVRLTT